MVLLPRPHPWQQIPTLRFFEPGVLQAALGPHPRILILPFGIHGPSSFWQQENGYGFSQTGGYLGFPPAPMQHFIAVGDLFGNLMEPGFLPSFTQFVESTHTQFVVEGPGTPPRLAQALQTLQWQQRQINDVTVLTVPGG
jgi:hypothetical protein